MKEINREGVQIDMCATCHGVWLDRGELNKLLEINRQDFAPAAAPPQRDSQAPRQREDYDDHNSRGYGKHGGNYRKKSKFESLFDMFD
jgi:Zn-finger nucleic acid-binding protein